MATLDELLNSLQNPNKKRASGKLGSLSNSRDTWSRIGSNDKFAELGLEPSALQDFLKEWVEENPYNNI